MTPTDVHEFVSDWYRPARCQACGLKREHAIHVSQSRIRSALVERKAEPLEHVEKVSTEAAMSQWERSLKRPDLCEKDRVRGAIEAYKRQAFAFAISPTPPAAPVTARPLADVVAMSASIESKRVLQLHFNREVTDDDRRRLIEWHNASASPSPVDSREDLIAQLTRMIDIAENRLFLIERLVKALKEITAVPEHRPRTGHLYECAWCNGSAKTARAALATAKEQQP